MGGSISLAGAYYNRGNACYDKHDFPNALTDYDRALKLKQNYPMALFGRGLAKKQLGDFVSGDAGIAASKALKAHID